MSDLRNLAERAASWQQNGDTPAGTSSDWAAFQRAAAPDVVLGLLDERDRLREWVEGLAVGLNQMGDFLRLHGDFTGRTDVPIEKVRALIDELLNPDAALQGSPDDR